MPRLVLLLGCALSLAACPDEGAPAPEQAAVAIDSIPVLDIAGTGLDHAEVLSDPVGAARFGDGTIAIADRGAFAVHLFSGTGQLLTSVGRLGDGPGEFRELTWLGRCDAGSVLVWDRRLQRMTRITAEGLSSRWPHTGPDLTTISCDVKGRLAYFGPPETLPSTLDQVADAEVMGSLHLASGVDSPVTRVGLFPMGQARPLGRVTALAIGGDRLLVGTGASGEILTFDLRGRPAPPLTSRVPARPATLEHYDRAIARQLEMFRDPAGRKMGEEILRRIPMPTLLPAHGGLWADADGVVWVQLSLPGDAGTWLRGLTLANEVVADLRLPQEVRVFEVGRDYLLGSTVAPDGTPHVVQFALRQR